MSIPPPLNAPVRIAAQSYGVGRSPRAESDGGVVVLALGGDLVATQAVLRYFAVPAPKQTGIVGRAVGTSVDYERAGSNGRLRHHRR